MQPQNEQFVQSLLEEGEFFSREDVVDAAVERWRTQRDGFANLREMVQVGIDELDRGEGAPLEIDDVIASGRERLAARNPQN